MLNSSSFNIKYDMNCTGMKTSSFCHEATRQAHDREYVAPQTIEAEVGAVPHLEDGQ